jgi:4-amino-4-deoxy-L-arabinose transferase-like glycosyltransferase
MSSLRRTFAIVALALVIAPLVANAPLFDPDEGLHAAIAQEMVRTGDYITPRFLGEPFLDKPILFFWAEAFSLRVFGMNEAAVRIPPLLFGVLGMVSVAFLGRALFDEPAGLIAGIVYGTMLVPMGVGEIAVHDVAVVPFMCGAIALLLATKRGPATVSAAGAGVCLGLSILTKGLVGVAFAGLFAVCLAAARPSLMLRLAIALTVAVIVAAVIAAPWYVAMEHAHPGYLHYYFIERHLQGYLTATQRHAGRGWWYYVPIVIAGSLPWFGYLVPAARAARDDRRRLVVWGWFVAGFVFLSAGESKLATYALPLFPALAILIGESIARVNGAIDRLGYGIYAATLSVMPICIAIALQMKFGGMTGVYWTLAVAITLAIAFVSVSGSRMARHSAGRVVQPFTGAAPLPSLMALFGLMIFIRPAAAWMTSRDVARQLNAAGALPPQVTVVDERVGSLIFYLDPALRAQATRQNIEESDMAATIQRSRIEPLDGIVIVRNNLLYRFARQFGLPPGASWTAGTNTVFREESLQKALQGIR